MGDIQSKNICRLFSDLDFLKSFNATATNGVVRNTMCKNENYIDKSSSLWSSDYCSCF